MNLSRRLWMVDRDHADVSVVRQCELLASSRGFGVLQAGRGFRVRLGLDGADGQAIPANALLWVKEDGRLAQEPGIPGQQKARTETDATDGNRSYLPSPQDHQAEFKVTECIRTYSETFRSTR